MDTFARHQTQSMLIQMLTNSQAGHFVSPSFSQEQTSHLKFESRYHQPTFFTMSDAAVLSRVSGGAIDGRLGYLRVRQRLFLSFHSALIKHREAFLEAVKFDDGCSTAEAQIVFASALIELRNHYDLLNFQQDLELEYSLVKKKSNENRRKPIALTYIIPNSFNLLYNVVSALSAALEAGSCVIVEVCDQDPNSGRHSMWANMKHRS